MNLSEKVIKYGSSKQFLEYERDRMMVIKQQLPATQDILHSSIIFKYNHGELLFFRFKAILQYRLSTIDSLTHSRSYFHLQMREICRHSYSDTKKSNIG